MKRALRGLLCLATLAIAAVVLILPWKDGGKPAAASSTSATVTIRFSHFEQTVITVPAGQSVSVTLNNTDPIEHEWIVGTEEVHERHRTGTDGYHNQIPTEVTIPALTTSKTMVRFDTPGDYPFICHLPGHEAYGMKGILRVVAQ
jgi:uncharacterized cupredoxin-like copper-binding protein